MAHSGDSFNKIVGYTIVIIIQRIGEFKCFRELHLFVAETPVRMSVFCGQEMGLTMGRLGA